MFRDLKEYQEIAKIYADKVSKPENLEERRGSSPEQLAANRKDAFKGVPNSASNKRAEMSKERRGDKKFEFKKPTGGAQGRTKRPEPEIKKFPSTAEIRAKSDRVGGGNAGASTDSGGTQGKGGAPEIKKPDPTPTPQTKPKMGSPDSKFIKKERGKGPGFVKRGTPVAQRAENQEKNRNRAKEAAKARLAKKAGTNIAKPAMEQALIPYIKPTMPLLKDKSGNFYTTDGKPFDMEKFKDNYNKKKTKTDKTDVKTDVKSSYEYDAYDLVLEYLLSSEQVATIEEANYVMTEMDAETIQSIVEAQKKTS